MNTLDRYIQSLFLKNLAFTLLGLVSLYGVIEFIEKVDDFIEHQAASIYYLLFPLYNMPLIISNTLPMAVLLSAFATVGGLSRTNQLTALLGGGISISRISRPIFLIAFALSGVLLLCNLWLTPIGIQETEYIRNFKIKGEVITQDSVSNDLYFRAQNRIVHIQRSFPQREALLGVTAITFDEHFLPVERLQADSAIYQESGIWQLKKVKIWEFSPDEKKITAYAEHEDWQLDLKKVPEEISQIWNTPEEMSQAELARVIDTLQRDGYDPQKFLLESQMRYSKAFIPIIMILLGMPFALQRGRQASFALGVIISLTVFIIYFILYAVFAALGGAAILPPVVAAWAANILMALTGTWLFLNAQE